MTEDKFLIFNLWPATRAYWPDIVKKISERFSVVDSFECVYNNEDITWGEFLIVYYSMASDPPGIRSYINERTMRVKADRMKISGKFFLTLILNIENDKYKKITENNNPWEPIGVGILKKEIRNYFMENHGLEKYEIAHCFESHVYTNEIIEFIKDNCRILPMKFEAGHKRAVE
jgi:hypothetical protein